MTDYITAKDDPAKIPDQKWYGRLYSVDERDHKFLLPRREEALAITSRYWTMGRGMPLDQGPTPQCVAYAGMGYLNTSPVRNVPPFSPAELYHQCQLVDEWPGENYDGTSVRALFKVLTTKGYIDGYQWAFNFDPVLHHVLAVGPVVMGTYWFTQMDTPDANGYLWPQGSILGGHAWLIIGASQIRVNPDGTKGAFRMINSWGPDWASHGRAWLTFESLDRLIAEEGEACTAMEKLVK